MLPTHAGRPVFVIHKVSFYINGYYRLYILNNCIILIVQSHAFYIRFIFFYLYEKVYIF